MYSVVVPTYNEAATVKELHHRLVTVLSTLGDKFEIIFVDDGSTDDTAAILQQLSPLTVIRFRKNFGQTAALDAGIKNAQGDIIITLDADLQNPPEEIPKLLNELERRHLDVVAGWRKRRRDALMKRWLSRGANALRRLFINDGIHDSGCTLKVFRRECFADVDLFGEIHRFIPGVLRWQGFTIGEIEVQHQPRSAGRSKYNSNRLMKGLVDILGLWFWRKYSTRPLHLFGGSGIILTTCGSIILLLSAVARLWYGYPLSNSIWPLIAILFILVGIQLFISGLLAEIVIKNYYHNNRKPYHISAITRS